MLAGQQEQRAAQDGIFRHHTGGRAQCFRLPSRLSLGRSETLHRCIECVELCQRDEYQTLTPGVFSCF